MDSFLNILNSFSILRDVVGLLQQGEYVRSSTLPHRNIVSSLSQPCLERLESSVVKEFDDDSAV